MELLLQHVSVTSTARDRFHTKLAKRYPANAIATLRRKEQARLYRKIAYRHGNIRQLTYSNPLQPHEYLLDTVHYPVDIVAPALVMKGEGKPSALLFMEDHFHQTDNSISMGKSTILRSLIRLSWMEDTIRSDLGIPGNVKVPAGELVNRLNDLEAITIMPKAHPALQLLSGDITYIGLTHSKKLAAMTMIGVKEDFVWDLSRSSVRGLVDDYLRFNPQVREAQLLLANKLLMHTERTFWASSMNSYPVSEVIVLTRDAAMNKPAEWGVSHTMRNEVLFELRELLRRNPLYLSSITNYWQIDGALHTHIIDKLFNKGFEIVPAIRYLRLQDPRNPDSLQKAVQLLNKYIQSKING